MIGKQTIAEARQLLENVREKSDSPVFQTAIRDEFILVSKVLHTQRMDFIEEFNKTGQVTKTGLYQEFGIYATVLETNDAYKSQTSEKLHSFWQDYKDAADIDFIKDTTQYWDKSFDIFGKGSKTGTMHSFDRILEDVAHLHVAITGHTRHEDAKLISGLYTTKWIDKAKHQPQHSFAVTNQSWLQDGTIIWDYDQNPIFQPKAGDVLFMPPETPHDPPELKITKNGVPKPRFMFTAEMRGLNLSR